MGYLTDKKFQIDINEDFVKTILQIHAFNI